MCFFLEIAFFEDLIYVLFLCLYVCMYEYACVNTGTWRGQKYVSSPAARVTRDRVLSTVGAGNCKLVLHRNSEDS